MRDHRAPTYLYSQHSHMELDTLSLQHQVDTQAFINFCNTMVTKHWWPPVLSEGNRHISHTGDWMAGPPPIRVLNSESETHRPWQHQAGQLRQERQRAGLKGDSHLQELQDQKAKPQAQKRGWGRVMNLHDGQSQTFWSPAPPGVSA